ncbi:MAG: hypothetical protein HY736_20900 [Verrucomicrobia bacterium]|nr:hypothetical protein [Verrucomicrobiota bacterium]
MKSLLSFAALRCCLPALLGVSFAGGAYAQNPADPPKNRMLTLSYLKPEPGKTADYLNVAQLWKPVHQDMVNKGRLTSWKLYAVSWPNGEEQEYDRLAQAGEGPALAARRSDRGSTAHHRPVIRKFHGDAVHCNL